MSLFFLTERLFHPPEIPPGLARAICITAAPSQPQLHHPSRSPGGILSLPVSLSCDYFKKWNQISTSFTWHTPEELQLLAGLARQRREPWAQKRIQTPPFTHQSPVPPSNLCWPAFIPPTAGFFSGPIRSCLLNTQIRRSRLCSCSWRDGGAWSRPLGFGAKVILAPWGLGIMILLEIVQNMPVEHWLVPN